MNFDNLQDKSNAELIDIIENLKGYCETLNKDKRVIEQVFESYKRSINNSLDAMKKECQTKAQVHLEAIRDLRKKK